MRDPDNRYSVPHEGDQTDDSQVRHNVSSCSDVPDGATRTYWGAGTDRPGRPCKITERYSALRGKWCLTEEVYPYG